MLIENNDISSTLGKFFKYILVIYNDDKVDLEMANTQHEVIEIKKTYPPSISIDVYETMPKTALSRKGKTND